MDISGRLKDIRESKNLSKNQLAKLAGVSQSYISDIESGKKKPTLEILERICSGLGITIVHLLQESSAHSHTDIPPDLQRLLNAAKDLTPEQREQLTKFIQSMKG